MRSIKQRANDRRLGLRAKRRTRKGTFVPTRKTIKRKTAPKRGMVKRRKTSYRRRASSTIRRVSKSRKGLGSFLKRGIIGETTQALGAGMVVSLITDRVAPQATPFATLGAEYLAGGLTGTIAAEGIKSITGQPSILGGVFGSLGFGSSGQTTEMGV